MTTKRPIGLEEDAHENSFECLRGVCACTAGMDYPFRIRTLCDMLLDTANLPVGNKDGEFRCQCARAIKQVVIMRIS